jgi:hypothetical protein
MKARQVAAFPVVKCCYIALSLTIVSFGRKAGGPWSGANAYVEAGAAVPDEIFDEFLEAAENDRTDTRYKALLGSVGCYRI